VPQDFIFDFRFFHGSVSPKRLSIPLGCFEFFKNSLRYSQLKVHHRCSWTGGKWKKSSIRKVRIIFLHLSVVELIFISRKYSLQMEALSFSYSCSTIQAAEFRCKKVNFKKGDGLTVNIFCKFWPFFSWKNTCLGFFWFFFKPIKWPNFGV
jgi:hypothetical protein